LRITKRAAEPDNPGSVGPYVVEDIVLPGGFLHHYLLRELRRGLDQTAFSATLALRACRHDAEGA
jgi:hypothetical protein